MSAGYYDTCKGMWIEPEPATQPAEPSGAAAAAAGPHPGTPDRAAGAELDLDATVRRAQQAGAAANALVNALEMGHPDPPEHDWGDAIEAALHNVPALVAEVRRLRSAAAIRDDFDQYGPSEWDPAIIRGLIDSLDGLDHEHRQPDDRCRSATGDHLRALVAEVRRLRAQVPDPQADLEREADAPSEPAAGLGPGILGRALIDSEGDVWLERGPDLWQFGSLPPRPRAELTRTYGEPTEVLLVSPSAGRVLDAARRVATARHRSLAQQRGELGADFDGWVAIEREVREAEHALNREVDALDGAQPAEPAPTCRACGVPTATGVGCGCTVAAPAPERHADCAERDAEPAPEPGSANARQAADQHGPGRPAGSAGEPSSTAAPEPDSGPGWNREGIEDAKGRLPGDLAAQVDALLADRDGLDDVVDSYRQGYGGLRDRASTLVRERDTARAERDSALGLVELRDAELAEARDNVRGWRRRAAAAEQRAGTGPDEVTADRDRLGTDLRSSLDEQARLVREVERLRSSLPVEAQDYWHWRSQAERVEKDRDVWQAFAEKQAAEVQRLREAVQQRDRAYDEVVIERDRAAEALATARRDAAADARDCLAELVALKDGPRDADYKARKPAAWERARAIARPVPGSPQPASEGGGDDEQG